MDTLGKAFTVDIDGQPVSLRFKRPTVEELMAIDLEYRRVYSEAMRAGVMTEIEARKTLKKNEVWTKADEKHIDELSMTVATLSALLNKIKDDKTRRDDAIKLVNQITETRTNMIQAIKDKTDLFTNTAEGIANDQKIHKMCELCCVRSDTKEPFFSTRGQYVEFAVGNKEALGEIYKQAYYFEIGFSEDLSADWEEVKFLTQLSEDIKNEQAVASTLEEPADPPAEIPSA